MAQRMMGYAQAGRIPAAKDFEALIAGVDDGEGATLAAGQPYPFYLAQSWARPVEEMEATLGPPQNWIAEWKFDGIRAQLVKRGAIWRLWSRGEELISDSYPDLAPLADALAGRRRARRRTRRAGRARKRPRRTRSKASRRSPACNSGSAERSSAPRRWPNCRSPSSPTICWNSAAATFAPSRSTCGAPNSQGS